jgi:hypothetical protein
MIEMYKLMADPNYFPIEVETEEKRVAPNFTVIIQRQ